MSDRVKCADCGRVVAVLRKGSMVRRGAVMVCAECRKNYAEDTTCAQKVPDSNYSGDVPDFLRDMLNGFGGELGNE